jgi:hypothetical protein
MLVVADIGMADCAPGAEKGPPDRSKRCAIVYSGGAGSAFGIFLVRPDAWNCIADEGDRAVTLAETPLLNL